MINVVAEIPTREPIKMKKMGKKTTETTEKIMAITKSLLNKKMTNVSAEIP